jgi:N-acetyl-gamma-glutamyl-phosphate reductase
MSSKLRVGIYGATGYVGQDLVDILAKHPYADIAFATSNTYAGQLVQGTNLRYIKSEEANLADVDAVFLSLPHKASAPVAKIAAQAGKIVVDLSADLRFDEANEYQKWYDIVHPHPELLAHAPYGIPELHRDKIAESKMVGVAGCYPTATLLGLYPLLSVQGLDPDAPIFVDAKSGISGAGRTPTDTTHFVEVYGDIIPYKTGRSHRHVGEIEQEIRRYMPMSQPLVFVPHLVPVDRGLMASIYVSLNATITADKVHDLYISVYDNEPLVHVLPLGSQATFKHVQRANTCEISITPINENYLHISSTIDNLRKGAASQAVQCFNLMMNLPETEGLL